MIGSTSLSSQNQTNILNKKQKPDTPIPNLSLSPSIRENFSKFIIFNQALVLI